VLSVPAAIKFPAQDRAEKPAPFGSRSSRIGFEAGMRGSHWRITPSRPPVKRVVLSEADVRQDIPLCAEAYVRDSLRSGMLKIRSESSEPMVA
jgi:hypothetical protein